MLAVKLLAKKMVRTLKRKRRRGRERKRNNYNALQCQRYPIPLSVCGNEMMRGIVAAERPMTTLLKCRALVVLHGRNFKTTSKI